MLDDLMERLQELREEPLSPLTTGALLASLAAVAALWAVVLTSDEGWVPILDSLNLVFHEAGHPIFGVFGHTVGFLGGTLMQLLVPLAVAAACWAKRQPAAIGLAGVWFFENFLNIARYMADARAQELPLVGGGEHDWATLFGQWGLLTYDTSIARAAAFVGWSGMVGCVAWLAWRWHRRG